MAEVFFLTRGNIDHVERFVNSMRNLTFPFTTLKNFKDELGKEFPTEITAPIYGQLRPYQLWGFVVPDEKFVEPLCNSLGIPEDEKFFDVEPKEGVGTGTNFVSGKGIKFHTTAMRLALGANKLPEKNKTAKGYPILTQIIYKDFVNVIGIGWRPDVKIKTAIGKHEAI